MPDGLAALNAALEQWTRDIQRAAAEELAVAAQRLEEEAKATTVYADDTGATRGSTVAYVVSGDGSVDQESKADAAFRFAENRNPGSATDDHIGVEADEVVAIVTVFTDYAPDLENRQDGFIAPAVDQQAPALHQAAENGIRKVNG